MMKSFFKKLSLVMALAMVVSLVAPAGSAFAAEAGIALQGKKTTVEAIDVEVGGEVVDLCFLGAPADWKSAFAWTSGDETIASVDRAGKVTGLKAGETTVTITAGADGSYKHTVKVTVTEPKVEVAYEVKQVSDTKAQLVFNQNVSLTKNDVTLEIVYDGGFTAAWPIKNFECKDNVVTFEPYVAFNDGDTFIIKAGAADEGTTFTTKIGVVDQVIVSYKTVEFGDLGKDKAYTNGEEGTELTVQMSAKLYSNGIDVTNVYDTADVVYTLSEENEYAMIDEYAGTIVFSKAGVAVNVLANYVYYDDNDEEQKVPTVCPIISEMAPTYTVTGVKAWTVIAEDATEVDWSKIKHDVPAYDNYYKIVALITDNYGNLVSTVDGLTHKNMKDVQNYSDSRFANEGYWITYSSANVEKLLVGDNGTLTTYTKATVPAIFALRNSYVETDDQFVRNIYAATVTVKDARKLDKITLDNSSLTLVTDGEYTTGKVTLKAYDQYGGDWTNKVALNVSSSVAATNNSIGDYDLYGKMEFNFDGSEIDCEKNTFTLTFKADNSKTATLKINLKDPKYYDHDDDATTAEVIKVTSYQLAATGANQTVAKQADYKGSVAAEVNYYTLSNGYKVGTRSDVTLVTNADQLKLTTATATKGQQFIVIYNPDNAIVGEVDAKGLGVAGGAGKYTVTVADDLSGQMQYAKTGTYTVKVLQVSSFNKKDEAVFSTKYSTSFKVDNNNAAVALMKQEKLETAETAIQDIVVDTLKFTLGGSEWKKLTAAMVAGAKVVENEESGYIVIEKVTINVPLNGDNDSIYYTVEVPVNKAVKVGEGYSWK